MKSTVKIGVGALIALAVVVFAISVFIDSLIRRGIEKVGSHSLGVEVELARADLSILKGEIALSGLKISNPEGFATDSLLEAKLIKVKVQPASLLGDDIAIDGVFLDGSSLTMEQSVRGTNVSVMLEKAQGEGSAEEQKGKQKAYRIEKLRITDSRATFASFLTAGKPIPLPLPDIEMDNISSEDGTGVLLGQVIQQVLVKMLQTTLTAGKGVLPAEVISGVTGDLRHVAPEVVGGIVEKSKGVLDKAGGAVGNIFKK